MSQLPYEKKPSGTQGGAARSSLLKFFNSEKFQILGNDLKGLRKKSQENSQFLQPNYSVLFKNHFFFITGVKVKFRFERLRNKLRSSTFDNCEITAWSSEICIISSDNGEDFFADELLVYKEWKAGYEVEE